MRKQIDVRFYFDGVDSKKAEELLEEFLNLMHQNSPSYGISKIRFEEGSNVATFYPEAK